MRTGRKDQQAMFLENLWKEMDRITPASGNGNLAKSASRYASEGYDHKEIVELLVADGFDPYMSRECVEKVASGGDPDETSESDGPTWNFEAEDDGGDVVGSRDMGCDGVRAPTEAVAIEKAQQFLDFNCSKQYTVTRVSRS